MTISVIFRSCDACVASFFDLRSRATTKSTRGFDHSPYSHQVLGVSHTVTLASFVDPVNFGFNNP